MNLTNTLSIKKLFIYYFLSLGIAISTFFFINYLNYLPPDSSFKHSFMTGLIFLLLLMLINYKQVFLHQIETIETIHPKIYPLFIGCYLLFSYFSYTILYKDDLIIKDISIQSIFAIIMFFCLFSKNLIYFFCFLANLIFFNITIDHNNVVFNSSIFLVILFTFYYFIFYLKTKFFENLLLNQFSNIKYKSKFNNEFLSKFTLDFVIAGQNKTLPYYYDNENNICYYIKLNIEKDIKEIINNNFLKVFLLNYKLKQNINIDFKNLDFYCFDDLYLSPKLKNKINFNEEPEDLKAYIKQYFHLNKMVSY
jgi:hypothetical protein